MKRVSRFCLVLLIALLVIAPTMMITRAQGSACLPGLQAADCDLMTAAGTGAINSFTMDWNVAIKVTGIEGVQAGGQTLHDLTLNVTGSGPLSLDKSKLPATFSRTDPSTWSSAVSAVTLGNAVKIDLTNGPTPSSHTYELRIIDSKVYYKSDSADVYPSDQKDKVGQWLVVAVDPAQLSAMPGGSSLQGMMGGAQTGAQMAQMQAMMKQFMTIPGFITATRSDANSEATFTVNVDIPTLLKSPQFKPILTSIMASVSGGSGTAMDDNQLNAYLGMITPYVENLKITATNVIGTEDKLIHGVGFHLALGLTAQQLQSLGGLMGGSSGGSMPTFTNPLSVDFNFMVKLSNLNQPIKLDVPAGAISVPMMSGGSAAPMPAATSAQ